MRYFDTPLFRSPLPVLWDRIMRKYFLNTDSVPNSCSLGVVVPPLFFHPLHAENLVQVTSCYDAHLPKQSKLLWKGFLYVNVTCSFVYWPLAQHDRRPLMRSVRSRNYLFNCRVLVVVHRAPKCERRFPINCHHIHDYIFWMNRVCFRTYMLRY